MLRFFVSILFLLLQNNRTSGLLLQNRWRRGFTSHTRYSSKLWEQKEVKVEVTAETDAVTNNATAAAVEYLVDSIRSGRVEELQQKGFQVKKKLQSDDSKLLQNLEDEELVRHVLDSSASEVDDTEVAELEKLMQQRMDTYSTDDVDDDIISPSIEDIDPEVNAEAIHLIQREAQQMMKRMADDNDNVSEDEFFNFELDVLDKLKTGSTIVAGEDQQTGAAADGKRGSESSLTAKEESISVPVFASESGGKSSKLKQQLMEQARAAHEASMRSADIAADPGAGPPSTYSSPLNEQEEDAIPSEINKEEETDSSSYTAATTPTPSISSPSKDEQFGELLRATIDDMSSKGESADRELKKSTINAMAEVGNNNTTNISPLDVKSILGDTLFELTSSLGIDMEKEIAESEKAKADLQSIMMNSALELASNIQDLEDEGQKIFDKMENMKAELMEEAEDIDELRMDELDDLFLQQATVRSELLDSQYFLQNSTQNLEKLMLELDRDADLVTALALFPLKSLQKKIAFVVGLAFLFKVPYDAINLLSVREFEGSLWTSLLLQLGVSLACFDYFGLIRALRITLSKRK